MLWIPKCTFIHITKQKLASCPFRYPAEAPGCRTSTKKGLGDVGRSGQGNGSWQKDGAGFIPLYGLFQETRLAD